MPKKNAIAWSSIMEEPSGGLPPEEHTWGTAPEGPGAILSGKGGREGRGRALAAALALHCIVLAVALGAPAGRREAGGGGAFITVRLAASGASADCFGGPPAAENARSGGAATEDAPEAAPESPPVEEPRQETAASMIEPATATTEPPVTTTEPETPAPPVPPPAPEEPSHAVGQAAPVEPLAMREPSPPPAPVAVPPAPRPAPARVSPKKDRSGGTRAPSRSHGVARDTESAPSPRGAAPGVPQAAGATGGGGGPATPSGAGEGSGAARTEFASSEVDRPPAVISKKAPVYPREARRANVTGRVVVKFLVMPDGTPSRIAVVEAAPPGVFEESVIEALKGWRFSPGQIHGRAVATWAALPVRFSLDAE